MSERPKYERQRVLEADPRSDSPVSNCLLDLAPPDIQWFQERSDIVLVPIGSCEQHGAHLPLGTDTITALEVSRRAAAKAGVPYTAPLWIGYSPQHMRETEAGVGTITVRASTLNAVLYDILRSLIHHGWNKLILVNGHGSNTKVLDPLLRRIKYETGALVALYKPYAERYIGILEGLLENPPEETPGWHASELETSQVLAHNASLVRMDRAADDRAQAPPWLPESFLKRDGAPDVEFEGYQYFTFPMDHGEFSRTGVIGNPMRATAEKGEKALERFSDHLVRAIDEFRGLTVDVRRREFEERV
jgi:creatinine amidohydrolase